MQLGQLSLSFIEVGGGKKSDQNKNLQALKGESSSQACRSYMIVNVIVKDQQNFFFIL